MNISKHMIIVIIAVVVIAVGLVASFTFLRPDPQQVAINSIEKQLKLEKYNTNYNLSYSTKSGGLSVDATGTMGIVKNGNISKIFLVLDTFGEKIRIEQYQTDDGVIQCMRSLLNMTCQKVPESSIPLKTPQEQLKALEELINKKILQLSYLSTRTVAGRTCDEIRSFYDPKKEDPLTEVSGNIQMDMCLDKEVGLPLEIFMDLSIGSTQSTGAIKIKMSLTNLDFDAPELTLPEYTNASLLIPEEEYSGY